MTGYPEIDAILERAVAYQREVYARLGQPPMTFLVTAQEYQRLICFEGYGLTRDESLAHGKLQLSGMRVIQPEHRPWYGHNAFMEHFKPSQPSGEPFQGWAPLPSLTAALIGCRTERPPRGRREIVCPCSEVIWDLPPLGSSLLTLTVADLDPALASLLGPPPEHAPCAARPPTVNSETSSLEEWEAAVHTMIADAKQRRLTGSGAIDE